MTTNTLVKCIEEAAEFGDRFPDVSDTEVLIHVSEVEKLSAYLEEDWAVSRAILRAYDAASAGFVKDESIDDGILCAKAWGLIPSEYKHEHYA